MGQSEKYQRAYEKYKELQERGAQGDRQARLDKQKIAQELRQMEREGNNAGEILHAKIDGAGKVSVEVEHTDSKRDLQKEYVRGFERRDGKGDEAAIVKFKNPQGEVYEGTLAEWHKRRLFGK